MTVTPRIALVAGEASGDQLGAGLIEAIRHLVPQATFVGVAGPAMRAAGCEAWQQAEELSVMGLFEVLRHLPRLARIRRAVLNRMLDERPVVFVGIDAPDFNLRLAPQLRAAGIPTVQYVCPSVWAWRPGRTRLLKKACDRVLCLLPFEPAFLAAADVPATFVGHPFADEIKPADCDAAAARAALGLGARTVIGLLPGSRVAEVTRLGPPFLGAARLLCEALDEVEFVAPMANASLRHIFTDQLAEHAPGLRVSMLDGGARTAIAASDAVLAASGTVTLEAMLINRPMVVAYRASPATYLVATTLELVTVEHFSLPNLVAGERLVPELLQRDVTAARLAGEMLSLLRSPANRQALGARFARLGAQLRRNASANAARAVLEVAGLR